MKKLIQGIIEFRQNKLSAYREKYSQLALGQKPDTLFIACSDSRVVPNLFVSTSPGDLFVVRNVGNFVPSCHSGDGEKQNHACWAAIEFAVLNLKVSDIIVCGHSECGAIKAILDDRQKVAGDHLKNWLKHGERAVSMVSEIDCPPSLSFHNKVSQANVLLQLEHLKTYSIIRERMTSQELNIHGWWFDVGTGDVSLFDAGQRRFVLIEG